MRRNALVFLLLGALSWGQATRPGSATVAQQPSIPAAAGGASIHDSERSGISPDKPVITVSGLCDSSLGATGSDADCKTVITEAQFQKVVDAIQPNMPPRARRELALHYAEARVLAKRAEQMGLDNGELYEERMKIARIEVLSSALKKMIQEQALQISDKEIADYYQSNTTRFERAELDRIYVPKSPQLVTISEKHLSGAEQRTGLQESEPTMKKEADELRVRALAGEDFTKLQACAYQAAGIISAPPGIRIDVRRISLPPNHVSVMDLKPGEISSVLIDPNGYYVYKMKTKETLPLNRAREEIRATLHSQRLRDGMGSVLDRATPTLDESYFAR